MKIYLTDISGEHVESKGASVVGEDNPRVYTPSGWVMVYPGFNVDTKRGIKCEVSFITFSTMLPIDGDLYEYKYRHICDPPPITGNNYELASKIFLSQCSKLVSEGFPRDTKKRKFFN